MSTTPHDALFKAAFSNPSDARGELCAALPIEVVEGVDWSTLALVPGSFVDPSLTYRHTDLLFAVRGHTGNHALVYIVYEHQSACDPMMAFRLLRYLVRIWERWHQEHPDARSLPAIIPLVLYHGDAPWTAPLSFAELVDVSSDLAASLRPYLVDFLYRVDSICAVSDPELRAREASPYAVIATLSLKHVRTRRDVASLVVAWADLLARLFDGPTGADGLESVMRYILSVSEHITPAVLGSLVGQQLGPVAKDIAVTAGERLIAQGREQNQRDVLLSLLRQRFGEDVTSETELWVKTAAMQQLERWTMRILSAPSLSEIFKD